MKKWLTKYLESKIVTYEYGSQSINIIDKNGDIGHRVLNLKKDNIPDKLFIKEMIKELRKELQKSLFKHTIFIVLPDNNKDRMNSINKNMRKYGRRLFKRFKYISYEHCLYSSIFEKDLEIGELEEKDMKIDLFIYSQDGSIKGFAGSLGSVVTDTVELIDEIKIEDMINKIVCTIPKVLPESLKEIKKYGLDVELIERIWNNAIKHDINICIDELLLKRKNIKIEKYTNHYGKSLIEKGLMKYICNFYNNNVCDKIGTI